MPEPLLFATGQQYVGEGLSPCYDQRLEDLLIKRFIFFAGKVSGENFLRDSKISENLFVYKSDRICGYLYGGGGASYKLLVGLSKILPKRLVVWAIGKLYGYA